MKSPQDEEQLTRWIDGEMPEEEARAFAEAHPECVAERETALRIGDGLRSAFSEDRDIPYADFFSHQVRCRITEEEFGSGAAPEATEGPMTFPLFQRLRWLSAFGFVIAFGALVALVMNHQDSGRSEVVSTYTPAPGTSVTTAYDIEAHATVIRLDGIPDIPSSVVIGNLLQGEPQNIGRELFSLESRALGCPIRVLARDDQADDLPGVLLVGF
ncbi:MAG: hypothetical protein KDM64_13115 [Verrucomicrobiae bacterium]|nr:hypothetical protein [Verrucomicrobiae bacterium]